VDTIHQDSGFSNTVGVGLDASLSGELGARSMAITRPRPELPIVVWTGGTDLSRS